MTNLFPDRSLANITLQKFLIVCCAIMLSCFCTFAVAVEHASPTQAGYIGRSACAGCHQLENEQWTGSHHDLAMQEANDKTVLGDFNNASFKQFGIHSRFYRKGELFFVKTDGSDGKLTEYPIKYTFGFYPLQQYLIEFPGGRLQVLDIAWDSRSREEGGRRWMHLHPEDKIDHDDVLHWTGPNLNWNYMCADCHSTNLVKNYNADSDSYNTTWSELNVSCEACHGPGKAHWQWAKKNPAQQKTIPNKGLKVIFRDRKNRVWTIDKKTALPVSAIADQTEIAVCARCHSRRSQIAADHKQQPLMDAYIPSLLTAGLYHADGQIEDEVYVYGSFLQSKMYQQGVTCSDCHNPHSNALKMPGEQVCYQCHLAAKYATKKHHQHQQNSSGASCIECHMPATTYMQVDARHDHSFRIPRPDLSVQLATPNACNNCHKKKSVQWAAATVKKWYGSEQQGLQNYAGTLHAARAQLPAARSRLQELAGQTIQPAIARATALQELQVFPDRKTLAIIDTNLQDQNAMIRRSALVALRQFDLRTQATRAFPLLNDAVRAVRIEAISLLIKIPQGQLPEEQKQQFQQAMDEYIQVQKFNAERPEAQVNLGSFYATLGKHKPAEAAYEKALQLQSQFVPAYINLAQLYGARGQEAQAELLLRQGLLKVPGSPDLAGALGLSLVRQQKIKAALSWLSKAANLDKNNVRYGYVYAVALNSQGDSVAAIEQLKSIHQRYPGNVDIVYALVTFNRDAQNAKAALSYLWNDENILKYRVADFACGTGILLTSIYKKIISNYEINGGNMKIMHTRMMENCIHGLDVLPIATHLTVSALASIFPTRIFTKTKIHTMPIGIQLKGEKDYRLGSLDLIDDTNKSTTHHGIHDASCDLIVMNPPFVRPTNHVGTHQGDAVPAYAAFNTTIEDQKEMGKLASKKFQGTCANGNAGLASNFVAICDKKIAKNGTIALILPATICNGESWSAVRTLFNKYDITVISIARKELKLEDYAFSSDTGIGEIILIAKKHDKPKNSNNRGKFVVLSERPSSILSGIHIGTIIKKQGIIHKLENVHGGSLLKVGDKIVGTMLDCPIDKFWPFVNVVDPALIQYMHKITNNTTTKFITLGKISMVGPHALDITGNNLRGPFDRHYIDGIPLYPTLWNNDKDAQSSLIVKPDQMLIPRIDAKNDHVEKIWNTSTHMHININPRYTSQSIIAAYTNVPSVGGRSWPSIILNKKYEKALTIWCNSIFGIFYFWYITGKQQFGRGMSSRTAILSLLVPDFNTFDPKKLRLYNSLFDKYRYEKLLPICQLHRDSTRKKIDNELADILDIDINLDDLRLRLCSEPSISGGKLDDDLKKFDRGLLSFDSA